MVESEPLYSYPEDIENEESIEKALAVDREAELKTE